MKNDKEHCSLEMASENIHNLLFHFILERIQYTLKVLLFSYFIFSFAKKLYDSAE